MLQYFGLALVIGSWIGAYYLFSRWYNKDLPTISKHAASSKTTSRVFAVIITGFALVFYYWLNRWFVPELELSIHFQSILALTIVCQTVVGLAPDTVGRSRIIHRWAAYSMAVLYLPLGVLILMSDQVSTAARIACALLTLYMLITFILVAVMGKAKGRYLFFQASYLIAFQILILSAAYL